MSERPHGASSAGVFVRFSVLPLCSLCLCGEEPRRNFRFPFHHGTTLLALLLCLLLAACAHQLLPTLGDIPQFDLSVQTGQPFDSHSLDGHIWVANFVYTTCPGPCPMMSQQMHGIQTATAATPEVHLVSFTVDPEHDTPPVLAAYAKTFHADTTRWHFLTGAMPRLNHLGLAAFKLNSVDGGLNHSTRFALVDGRRRVRGYYLSSDESFPKNLLHDLTVLQHERP